MSLFTPAYTDDHWLGLPADYSVKAGYDWLRNPQVTVNWWKTTWNAMNIPKSSFIYWAVKHKRLLTRDRLARMGGYANMECYLCNMEDENHEHLFFYCAFSSRCSFLLQQWTHVKLNPKDLVGWNNRGRRHSVLRRRLMCAFFVMLVYLIWKARNRARILAYVTHPTRLVQQAIKDVLSRFWARNQKQLTREDATWIQKLHYN
ncbi:uncharacterized protein LOC141595002 [Silene latifolia]|uniref:uncharacterized protein LOC141595002 n=1 Tax=Silene latifolia TaxID=37657 RepID=UPI003D772DF6